MGIKNIKQMRGGLNKMKNGIVKDFELLFIYILFLFGVLTDIQVIKIISSGIICVLIFLLAKQTSSEIKIYMYCKNFFAELKEGSSNER